MDEVSGFSSGANVAGLGWKAGALTDLGNLEVLYVKPVQNIKITLFCEASHLHAAFLHFPGPRGIRENTSFLQDRHCFFKASS